MAREPTRSTQLPFAFDPAPPSHAREDFTVGATNEQALAFIEAWPSWPSRCGALWGPEGSGKTHLAIIWARAAEAQLIDPRAFSQATVAELTPGGKWLIDDADLIQDSVALFHLLNFVNQSSGALLLTGRMAPRAWSHELPDLRSRLAGLPGAALFAPDEALLAAEAGNTHHEELVEVRRRDRQEAQPLEQRMANVLGLVEHARVEREPRQLAIDEAVRRGQIVGLDRRSLALTPGRRCGGLALGLRGFHLRSMRWAAAALFAAAHPNETLPP